MVPLIVALVIAALVLVVVARAVRIIPQARAGIVERLGRYSRTLDPGLHVLIPFLDRLRRPLVDLREQVVTFEPQPVITQDNVTISVDTVFYFTITDPFRATYEVANLIVAVEQLTVTTLRNVIGSLSLEETLTSRDRINSELRSVLDEATNPWGIRVNRVELKSIDPPGSIQEAMEKQMRAERDKRAAILNAEGDKEAKILRAQGDAEATRQVFAAIHDGKPTPDLLAYQYLQTLPNVEGLKLMLIPAEGLSAMGAVSALGAAFQTGADAAKTDGAAPAAAPPAES